jgi:uncharacterized protein (DUF2147 family)
VLDKEIKLILGKPLAKANRYIRAEYLALKEENNDLKKQLRRAKKSGDRKEIIELTNKIDYSTEAKLKNQVNETVDFNFRNTKVTVKRSYLEKLKDPEKYVNKMYLNKTLNQIKKLEAKGYKTQAAGLVELAWKTNDKLRTDKSKQKAYKEKLKRINKRVEGKDPKEFNIKRKKDGETEQTEYAIIYDTKNATVSVTVI